MIIDRTLGRPDADVDVDVDSVLDLPAVSAALRTMRPAARLAIGTIVDAQARSSWRGLGPRWSRLTPTWWPLELSETSTDDCDRFVAEVAPAEHRHDRRLDAALALIARLGCASPSDSGEALVSAARCWQSSANLRWGAWLGARVDDNGLRCKLYLEIPQAASSAAVAHACVLGGLDRLPGRPAMVGIDGTDGRSEWYCEPGIVDRDDVRHRAGDEVLAILDDVGGRQWHPTDAALAVTIDRCSRPTYSVITSASHLIGTGWTPNDYVPQRLASTGLLPGLVTVEAQPAPRVTVGWYPPG